MTHRLAALIYAVLIIAIVIDLSLWIMTLVAPELWFSIMHTEPGGPLATLLLRRAGGHWLAFLLVQIIALFAWKREPLCLVVIAGLRFSDLFTDLTYLLLGDAFTTVGWTSMLAPPLLNLGMGLIALYGFRQTARGQRYFGSAAPSGSR